MRKNEIGICRKDGEPAIVLTDDGVDVTVYFSKEESPGVKAQVRDILTEAFNERLIKELSALMPI